MMGNELVSFSFNLSFFRGDDNELSDEDENGSNPNTQMKEDDYFSGPLKSFAYGCLPTAEESKNGLTNLSQPSALSSDNQKKVYLERSKVVGRLGPIKTQLDRDSAKGEFVFGHQRAKELSGETSSLLDMEGNEALALDVEAVSNFVSIRANTAVFKETFYYETTLLSDGLMQIGWCTINTDFGGTNGVGDSPNSYAYDGYRVEKWNVDHSEFGKRWTVGDVIGTLINLNTREILYWRNREFLGVAFKDVLVGPNRAYFPAASLQQGQRLIFNFGQKSFTQRLNVSCLAINEPDCVINSFNDCGIQLMDFFRDFVVGYCSPKGANISIDEKLSVGCLLVEYLMPIMQNTYYMDTQVIRFLSELVHLKKTDLIDVAYKVFDLCFNDDYITKWVTSLMTNLSVKIIQQPIDSSYDLSNYLGVVLCILTRPRFKAAWLQSPYFFQDLELMYSLHLMSKDEWKDLLSVVYHPLLSKSYSNKIKYEKNYQAVSTKFEKQQELLQNMTESLMDMNPCLVTR